MLDLDFRLTTKAAEYAERATGAERKGRSDARPFHKIADQLRAMEPELKDVERGLVRLLLECGFLAELKVSTLERGRPTAPNFALLFRNSGALDNANVKLHLPVQVGGEIEFIEAFGIDRLARGEAACRLSPSPGHWQALAVEGTTGRPRTSRSFSCRSSTPDSGTRYGADCRSNRDARPCRKGGAAARAAAGGGAIGAPNAVRASVEEREIVDLLAANWPMDGSRHETALALGGFFTAASAKHRSPKSCVRPRRPLATMKLKTGCGRLERRDGAVQGQERRGLAARCGAYR